MRPFKAFLFILALLLPLVFATGCHILRRPDLTRTAGIAQIHRPRRPLILVHGFLGSKLRVHDSQKVAWGTMANVLSGRVNDRLALPLGPDDPLAPKEELVPFEIYDSLWGVEYYSKILRILSDAGGYQVGDINNPEPGDNAFVFVYDWRRDNVEAARKLAEAIDALKARLGDSDLKFDLLTHSQGGLIARYYVKYGGVDVLDGTPAPASHLTGAPNVGKVIMLGTPNRGCLEALKILHLGVKRFFRPMRPEIVFTMPALYQMLPPPGDAHFATLDGTPVHLDLYDADTWVREGWSVFSPKVQSRLYRQLVRRKDDLSPLEDRNRQLRDFLARNLDRAERFQRAVNVPVPAESSVTYHAFGSDCIPTLKTAVLLQEKGKREIFFDSERFRNRKIGDKISEVLHGPGDGTVLMESLLDIPDATRDRHVAARPGAVQFDSVFFICEDHGLLPNDPFFQNNLFYLLLWTNDRPPSHVASAPARPTYGGLPGGLPSPDEAESFSSEDEVVAPVR